MRKFFSLIAAVLFAGSMMAADVTLNYAGKGYENAYSLDGVDVVESGVTFTLAKGTGSSAPAYYNTGTGARTYGGNTLTVDAGSSTITKIVFDFSQNNKDYTVNAGTYTKASSEWAGSATSVVFTTESGSGHNRIKSITVTLSEGGETPAEEEGLKAVKDSTTWDFSKITANTESANYNTSDQGIKLSAETTPTNTDTIVYADYAAEDGMWTLDASFDGETMAFIGQYPIRKNKYCMNGKLVFNAEVAGTIVVKFSDTGSSASATAVKRYLVVNGVQTEYWTSRENNSDEPYAAQLDVVTEPIAVPAGEVTITGSSAITIALVTFVPEEQEEPELPVYTCAQVQANEATAEGVLNEVTVMFVNGSNVFVKDETGMTQVYLKSNGLAIGDKVSGIKGASTLYKSTPEFVPTNAPADWTVVAGETPVYDEKETIATTADVNGVYVFKNVTFAEATEFTTEAQVNATVTIGEESIVLRNNYKFAYSFAADKAYDVKAVVVIYNNAAQLYFISAEEHISTAIDNTAVDAKAVKIVRDGQLLILKGNKTFNAQGAIVR